MSVRQVVKKSMVPVSHQECVPVIKDGWGKTVLKVGCYYYNIICTVLALIIGMVKNNCHDRTGLNKKN